MRKRSKTIVRSNIIVCSKRGELRCSHSHCGLSRSRSTQRPLNVFEILISIGSLSDDLVSDARVKGRNRWRRLQSRLTACDWNGCERKAKNRKTEPAIGGNPAGRPTTPFSRAQRKRIEGTDGGICKAVWRPTTSFYTPTRFSQADDVNK